MNSNTNTPSSGIGFVGLLTIVFITLKLTNFITWSWWWVLSPVWLFVCLLIVVALIAVKFVNSSNEDIQRIIQDLRNEELRNRRYGK
jgi:membrane protein YdbS with pleckstrin-like domain